MKNYKMYCIMKRMNDTFKVSERTVNSNFELFLIYKFILLHIQLNHKCRHLISYFTNNQFNLKNEPPQYKYKDFIKPSWFSLFSLDIFYDHVLVRQNFHVFSLRSFKDKAKRTSKAVPSVHIPGKAPKDDSCYSLSNKQSSISKVSEAERPRITKGSSFQSNVSEDLYEREEELEYVATTSTADNRTSCNETVRELVKSLTEREKLMIKCKQENKDELVKDFLKQEKLAEKYRVDSSVIKKIPTPCLKGQLQNKQSMTKPSTVSNKPIDIKKQIPLKSTSVSKPASTEKQAPAKPLLSSHTKTPSSSAVKPLKRPSPIHGNKLESLSPRRPPVIPVDTTVDSDTAKQLNQTHTEKSLTKEERLKLLKEMALDRPVPNAPVHQTLDDKNKLISLIRGQNDKPLPKNKQKEFKTKIKQDYRKVQFTDRAAELNTFVDPEFLAQYNPMIVRKIFAEQIQDMRKEGDYTDSEFDEMDDEIYEIVLSYATKQKKSLSGSTSELSLDGERSTSGMPGDTGLLKDLMSLFKKKKSMNYTNSIVDSENMETKQSKIGLTYIFSEQEVTNKLNLDSTYNVTISDVECALLRDFSPERVAMSQDRCFRLYLKPEAENNIPVPNAFFSIQEFILASGQDPEGPLITDHVVHAKFQIFLEVANMYIETITPQRASLLMHLAMVAPITVQGFLRQLAEAVVNRRLNSEDEINGFLNKIHEMATGMDKGARSEASIKRKVELDNFRLIQRLKKKIFSEFYRKVGFWEIKHENPEVLANHLVLLKTIPKLYKTGLYPFIDFIAEYIANDTITTQAQLEVALTRFLVCSDGQITRQEFADWCFFKEVYYLKSKKSKEKEKEKRKKEKKVRKKKSNHSSQDIMNQNHSSSMPGDLPETASKEMNNYVVSRLQLGNLQ